jgi:coproporphyrinogen III oxidase-like Fe-S oxidoreductase
MTALLPTPDPAVDSRERAPSGSAVDNLGQAPSGSVTLPHRGTAPGAGRLHAAPAAPVSAAPAAPLVDPGSFGVYVHVPFCLTRCHYCDFVTYTGMEGLRRPYAAALLEEAAMAAAALGPAPPAVTSVFVGGGTPTLLPPGDLARLLGRLAELLPFAPGAEVTVEANPETVDAAMADGLAEAGVTRVSMGAQSFDDRVLAALGRVHDAARVGAAVATLRAAGVPAVNLDLIYGGPGEDAASWSATLAAAVALGPEHLSAYALTIEPATKFGRLVAAGQLAEPGEDDLADRYDTTCATLAAAGYHHYEVSNWATNGPAGAGRDPGSVEPAPPGCGPASSADALHRPGGRFGPPEGERSPGGAGALAAVHSPLRAGAGGGPGIGRDPGTRDPGTRDPGTLKPGTRDSGLRTPIQASRHNLTYWRRGRYLGLGAGAHEFDGASRRWNVAGVPAYLQAVRGGRRPTDGEERLDPAQARFEALALRLRTADGLDPGAARALGVDPGGPQAQELRKAGLLAPGAGLALTEKGMFLHGEVVARLA